MSIVRLVSSAFRAWAKIESEAILFAKPRAELASARAGRGGAFLQNVVSFFQMTLLCPCIFRSQYFNADTSK